MAVFIFFDKLNQVNVSFASLSFIGSRSYIFQRIDKFEHKFSEEIFFKKTEQTNQVPQFVYDRWYQAKKFEIYENKIEIKEWIERDATDKKEENSMKNVVQVIGNNNNLSGSTFNLGDTNLEILFKGLEGFIQDNANIPQEEKQNLLSKLRDFINNPYLSGIAVNSLFNYIQPWLPKV
jgi:hypothetical protein